MAKLNPFEMPQQQLGICADIPYMGPDTHAILRTPMRELHVALPVCMDGCSTIAGKNQFGVITGKPMCIGGSVGRTDATARGGWYCVREAAKERCSWDTGFPVQCRRGDGFILRDCVEL